MVDIFSASSSSILLSQFHDECALQYFNIVSTCSAFSIHLVRSLSFVWRASKKDAKPSKKRPNTKTAREAMKGKLSLKMNKNNKE
jgi:hypothetical protein